MRTPEERLADFVETLARGGSLVVHPDTWAEMKANPDKLPPVLAAIVRYRRIDVITSELLEPDDMLAIEPRKFDESPFLRTKPIWPRIICADVQPRRWGFGGLAGA